MKKYIGSFNTKSGKLVISDPCYIKFDSKNNRTIDKCISETIDVKKGKWDCYVVTCKDDIFGGDKERIAELIVTHSGDEYFEDPIKLTNLGVDSGQMGIWDIDSVDNSRICLCRDFNDNDTFKVSDTKYEELWYFFNCNKTCGKYNCGMVFDGIVSSSGYGDGGYDVFISKSKDKDKIVDVRIVFIGDEEDDEDEDEYYHNED